MDWFVNKCLFAFLILFCLFCFVLFFFFFCFCFLGVGSFFFCPVP